MGCRAVVRQYGGGRLADDVPVDQFATMRIRRVDGVQGVDTTKFGDDRARIGRSMGYGVVGRCSDDDVLIEAVPIIRFAIARDRRVAAALRIDTVKNGNDRTRDGCAMTCQRDRRQRGAAWCDGGRKIVETGSKPVCIIAIIFGRCIRLISGVYRAFAARGDHGNGSARGGMTCCACLTSLSMTTAVEKSPLVRFPCE